MTGKAKRPDQVTHLLAALHEIRAPGHSQLYLWMRRNHDRIAEGLIGLRPNWRALAIRLGEMDIHDGTGKAPTPQGTRGTWYRVRRDLAAMRARQAKRQEAEVPLRLHEIAPGVVAAGSAPAAVSLVGSASQDAPAPQPSRPKLDIRPARPRGEVPTPQPGVSVPASTAAPKGSGEPAEAQLRRVLDAMASGATPMPRIVPPEKKS
jgi:hypothetical protein